MRKENSLKQEIKLEKMELETIIVVSGVAVITAIGLGTIEKENVIENTSVELPDTLLMVNTGAKIHFDKNGNELSVTEYSAWKESYEDLIPKQKIILDSSEAMGTRLWFRKIESRFFESGYTYTPHEKSTSGVYCPLKPNTNQEVLKR